MHFAYPITQTIDDIGTHHRMIAVHRVAAARKILVKTLVFFFKHIVNGIFKAAKIQRKAVLIPFGGMIEHNVQNNFQTVFMHFAHHFFKFAYAGTRCFIGCIGSFRRKKGDSAVTPVIFKPVPRCGIRIRVFVFVEFLQG